MTRLSEHEIEELFKNQGLSRICKDNKLSVALRATPAASVRETYNTPRSEWNLDQVFHDHLMTSGKIQHCKYNYAFYPKFILDAIYRGKYQCVKNTKDKFFRNLTPPLLKVLKHSIGIVLNQFPQQSKMSTKTLDNVLQESLTESDPEFQYLIASYKLLDPIVNVATDVKYLNKQSIKDLDLSVKKCEINCGYMPWKLYMGVGVFWLVYNNETFVLPRAYLLLMHNKLCDLISVWMYVNISTRYIYTANERSEFQVFIREFFELADVYKEDFFTIAKTLEALVQGEHIKSADNGENVSYLLDVVTSLKEETGWNYFYSPICSVLKRVSDPFRNELGCLSKIAGHPILDIESGVRNIVQSAREEIKLDVDQIAKSNYMSVKIFLNRYIKVKGKWPPCKINSHVHKRILVAQERGLSPDDNRLNTLGPIPLNEYRHIEIGKIAEFELQEDFMALVKDKTISRTKSAIIDAAKKGIKNTWDYYKETRLILHYFLNEDPHEKIRKYVKNHVETCDDEHYWELVEDYNVIRIVPKEKELKWKMRGFGAQTVENRMRCLTQEEGVAEILDQLFPEQALTMSELEISKRLMNLRGLKSAYKGYTPIYFSMDAKSWCSHFLGLPVKNVVKELDKYFQIPLYGETQSYFESCMFYTSDNQTTYCWYGQNGGIEGLNQYTWMFVYIIQIHTVLEELGMPYEILCKGDDLRVVVMVPNMDLINRKIEDIRDDITRRIAKGLEGVGHQIKINDSYASYYFLSFSKSASFRNIELPQVFRKIQKVYGANNAIIKDLDSYIGSSISNAHSSTRSGVDPISTFYVAMYWCMIYLNRESKYDKLPDDAKAALLLLPGALGGFPMIPFQSFLLRTESDMLSPYFDMLLYLEKADPSLFDYLKNFCDLPKPSDRSIRILVQDAYTVPIDGRPVKPEGVLKAYLKRSVSSLVKNTHLVELFSANLSKEEEEFYKLLDSCNVIHGRLFSLIYSKTAFGYTKELLRKFDTSSSMMKIITFNRDRGRKAKRIEKAVQKAASNLADWRKNKLMNPENSNFVNYRKLLIIGERCPSYMAYKFREILWGKPVIGTTTPSMTHLLKVHPSPSSDLSFVPDEHTRSRHFKVMYQDAKTTHYSFENNWSFRCGPYTPFIGDVTSSGNVGATKRLEDSEAGAHKAADLLTLCSWLKGSSDDVVVLLLKCFKQFTDASPALINVYADQKYKGTQLHHMSGGGFDPRISMNVLSNIMSKYKGVSSSHELFSGQTKHFINFLQVYGHGCMVLSLTKQLIKSLEMHDEYWLSTAKCSFCERPLEDPEITLDPILLDKYNPRLLQKVSKFVKIDRILMSIAQQEGSDPSVVARPLDNITKKQAARGYLYHFLWGYLHGCQKELSTNNYKVTQQGLKALQELHQPKKSIKLSLTDIRCISMDHLVLILQDYISTYFKVIFPGRDDAFILSHIQSPMSKSYPWIGLIQLLREGFLLASFNKSVSTITGISLTYIVGQDEIYATSLASLFFKGREYKSPKCEIVRLRSTPDYQLIEIMSSSLRNHFYYIFNQYYKRNMNHTALSLYSIDEWNSLRDYIIPIGTEEPSLIQCCVIFMSLGIEIFILHLKANASSVDKDRTLYLGNIFTLTSERITQEINSLEDILIQNHNLEIFNLGEGENSVFSTSKWGSLNLTGLIMDNQHMCCFHLLREMLRSDNMEFTFVYTDEPTVTRTLRNTRTEDEQIDDIIQEVEQEIPETSESWNNLHFSLVAKTFPPCDYNKDYYGIKMKEINEHYFEPETLEPLPNIVQSVLPYNHKRSYLKIIGLATNTLTYLYDILFQCMYKEENLRNLKILCTADGAGGHSWAWCNIVKQSTIYIATKQSWGLGPCTPHVSIQHEAHKNGNILDNYFIMNGADDVRSALSRKLYKEKEPNGYNIISCDATFYDRNSLDDLDILCTLIDIFAMSPEKCFLLCRVSATSILTKTGVALVSQLRSLSNNFRFVKPRSSNWPNEFYLACTRSKAEKCDSFVGIDLSRLSSLRGWFLKYFIEYNKESQLTDRVFELPTTLYIPVVINPPAGYRFELQKLHILVENDCEDILGLHIHPALARYRNELIRLSKEDHMKGSSATLTSKLHQVENFVFLKGFVKGNCMTEFNEADVLRDAISVITQGLTLAGIRRKVTLLAQEGENVLNIRTNFYRRFLRGILVGYRCCLYNSIFNRK